MGQNQVDWLYVLHIVEQVVQMAIFLLLIAAR